ncbi:MAG: hypothetical protein WDM81_03415 [Rhizomicrobium sp.]
MERADRRPPRPTPRRRDELHFLDRFFGDGIVTAETRAAIAAAPSGYGWHHGGRFGAESYWAAVPRPASRPSSCAGPG